MTILGTDVSHWNPEPLPWPAWAGRVSVVGIKLTGGLWLDVQAVAHTAAAKAADYSVMFGYHYLLGMAGQANKFLAALGPEFTFAMLDVEEPGLTEPVMRAFCDYYDAHETRPLVLYGNGTGLGPLLKLNPTRYAKYGVVWAEYGPDTPTSVPPYPASTTVPAWLRPQLIAWQYAGEGGRLPPYGGSIDLTEWYELPTAATPPVGAPPMRSGAQIGIHAEQASQTKPLMLKYKAAGVQIVCLLAMENPGLCVEAKQIDPSILTIARWHNPNHEYEGGGQQVADWPQDKRLDFVRKAIDLIFTRTNATEYGAADYFCPGLNEWDPPGVEGWRAMGEILLLLCQEATNRSPQMEALDRHPIRLAIPGFNNGTPEWDEMVALKATGIFDVMKARGDILIVHEGLWWNQGMNDGVGDLIPGAPRVPAHGGSKIGRVNYWTELLGLDIPFVVTEWYDGGTSDFTPPATRAAYIANYDRLMRHNPNYRGMCPFELTDVENGPWWFVDFTEAFRSPELLAYMLAERGKPNPTGDDEMPNVSDADYAGLVAANAAAAAILAKYKPAPAVLFRVKVIVPVLNIRSGPATTFADIGDANKDAVLSVYEVAQPSGWFRVHVTNQEWVSGGAAYTVKV